MWHCASTEAHSTRPFLGWVSFMRLRTKESLHKIFSSLQHVWTLESKISSLTALCKGAHFAIIQFSGSRITISGNQYSRHSDAGLSHHLGAQVFSRQFEGSIQQPEVLVETVIVGCTCHQQWPNLLQLCTRQALTISNNQHGITAIPPNSPHRTVYFLRTDNIRHWFRLEFVLSCSYGSSS